MENHHDLAAYRERLLQNIKSGSSRSACRTADSVQVFVNRRRIGSLDGSKGEAALHVRTDDRIEDVQLRSEDGVLLGGLSAPDYGARAGHIRLDRDTVELRVHNYGQGGSVNAVLTPASSFWRVARNAFSRAARAAVPGTQLVVPGMRTMAFTQLLLAVLLAGLVAEILTGGKMFERPSTPPAVTPIQAPWAAPLSEVAKLQQQLAEVSNMQTKAVDTIQAQQQGIAQLQRTIAKVSANQETVAAGVLTVKQEIEQRRKGAGREVDRLTRMLMSKAQNEQEQLEAEIQSLTVANDKLSKEMSDLEVRNQDLKKRLKAAGIDVSKAGTPAQDRPLLAQATESSPMPEAAEARPSSQPPFLFWVTFSDGTSEESIDKWVRDMRGRKGPLADGWQAVEIQPPTEPMERFIDHIKQAKIVKAVRVSR
jgi:hypothetical protein